MPNIPSASFGYRARKSKQTWWLATNQFDLPAGRILSFYDRRMTIEEQFRDIKGARFGVRLSWTQFRNPMQLARFVMLLGMAARIWLTTGRRDGHNDPSLRLLCKRKGPRQSWITIGLRLCLAQPFRWTSKQLRQWLEPPHLRLIVGSSRGGK